MSVTYINFELRRLVSERAERLCEYCLIAEDDTFFGCEIDHIISEKHGGPTTADNLAFCCLCCNQAKGSDIGSIDWESGQFVRFFNPRTDRWSEHFDLIDVQLEPRTPIGRATARILSFNRADRVKERILLAEIPSTPVARGTQTDSSGKRQARGLADVAKPDLPRIRQICYISTNSTGHVHPRGGPCTRDFCFPSFAR